MGCIMLMYSLATTAATQLPIDSVTADLYATQQVDSMTKQNLPDKPTVH